MADVHIHHPRNSRYRIGSSLVFRMFLVFVLISCLICVLVYFMLAEYADYVYQQEWRYSQTAVDNFYRYAADKYNSAVEFSFEANSTVSSNNGICDELMTVYKHPENDYSLAVVNGIVSFIRNICLRDDAILDCIAVSSNGAVYNYTTQTPRHGVYQTYPYLNREPFASFYQSDSYQMLYYGGIPEYTSLGSRSVITFVSKIYYTTLPTNRIPIGLLIINFSCDAFSDYVHSSLNRFQGDLVFCSEDSGILFSTNPAYLEKTPTDIAAMGDAETLVFQGKQSSELFSVYGIVSRESLWGEANTLRIKQLTIFTLGIVVCIFICGILYYHYYKRVNILADSILNADISVRLPSRCVGDELDLVSNAFNAKNEQLQLWIDRHYSAQLQLRTAELGVLTAQINPHFIYNTVESIRMKAVAEGDASSAEMLVLFGNMFRWAMRTGENAVSIADEIGYITSYLALQEIRFPGRYDYDIQVEPRYSGYGIPKLVLQPLVENAIIHNDAIVHPLHILISAEANQTDIVFSVTDDGQGMTETELAALRASLLAPADAAGTRIGCKNVHDRLRLLFGGGYGIVIDSVQNCGTTVRLRFPIMSVKEMGDLA